MADKRTNTWGDYYTGAVKGGSCVTNLGKLPAFKKCLTLPADATDAERVQCQRFFQKAYTDCNAAYEAYQGSGNKGVQKPPKPPS